MFIKYNDTNVHALPNVKMKQVRLKNKKTGKIRTELRVSPDTSPQDVQWLRPGWNNFPKAVWDQNKEHPSIVKMLRDKKIEILEEPITIKIGKKSLKKIVGIDDEEINIKDFPENRAIQICKDTYDRDILQRWLDEETRHKVKRALDKQIKPLLGEAKPESDEDEED